MTFIGKLLVIIISLWGTFLVSLIVVAATNVFALEKNQMKAMKDIHATNWAARAISHSAKFFLAKKKFYLAMVKLKPETYKESIFVKLLKYRPVQRSPNDSLNKIQESLHTHHSENEECLIEAKQKEK